MKWGLRLFPDVRDLHYFSPIIIFYDGNAHAWSVVPAQNISALTFSASVCMGGPLGLCSSPSIALNKLLHILSNYPVTCNLA